MPEPLQSESEIARADGEPEVARPAETGVEVRRGLGEAEDARLVEDRYIGVRASNLEPQARPLGSEQASEASEYGDPERSDDAQDVQVVPEKPSVWEALKPGED